MSTEHPYNDLQGPMGPVQSDQPYDFVPVTVPTVVEAPASWRVRVFGSRWFTWLIKLLLWAGIIYLIFFTGWFFILLAVSMLISVAAYGYVRGGYRR